MAPAARALALGLVLGLAPGCFVWEELEAGEEIMEEHGGGFGRAETESDEPEPSRRSGREPAAKEEGGFDPEAWWSKARTLAPGGSSGDADARGESSAVILCRVGGSERFMRRDECLGRGGTPAG